MNSDRYALLKKAPEIFSLSEKINGHRIFMYRDNPEDFAFGGNKVRFFEYLIPELLKDKPEVLVTSGSLFSNHIRVTAEVAALLGMDCELLITEDELPETLTGSAALAAGLGAKLIPVGHFAALLRIGEHMNSLKENGRKAFLVPNGGHTPGAVRAYSDVTVFALNSLEEKGVCPSAIFVPCASGTTHSGILCAEAIRNIPPVYSFAVANTPARAQKGISKLIKAASDYLPEAYVNSEVNVLDCGKNDYGHPDAELLALREQLIAKENITVDPTYNINAIYGMINYLENMPGSNDVLYINTGGFTGLH